MSTYGVGSIPVADTPLTLTQEAGSSVPSTVDGENGAAISTSSLTALYNSSGTYVGCYGIDASTGWHAGWLI
jgi:hypothetical protein